jgi:hypothetical protein
MTVLFSARAALKSGVVTPLRRPLPRPVLPSGIRLFEISIFLKPRFGLAGLLRIYHLGCSFSDIAFSSEVHIGSFLRTSDSNGHWKSMILEWFFAEPISARNGRPRLTDHPPRA